MKNGTTDLGTLTEEDGGLDGGGWVTGVAIADDGTITCRTDCAGQAGVRAPGADRFVQLFRWGDNFPMSEFATKILGNGNPTSWVYEAVPAPSDGNRIYAAFLGYLWRFDTRLGTPVKLTGYKAGVRDQTLTFSPHHEARIGGKHMAVDPANKDVVVLGHPVDAPSYSTDAGVTWQVLNGVPAPINATNERRGVNISFDRSSTVSGLGAAARTQTVVVVVEGQGTYRSTTGIGGAFTRVGTGDPTRSSSVVAANGRIFVCGDGATADSQLFMWNGTAWSQPTGAPSSEPVTGMSVDIIAGDPNKVLVMTIGGAMHYSSDAGAAWTSYVNGVAFETDGAECPYLAQVNNDYMSLGGFAGYRAETRIVAGCGIGVFEQTTIPRTTFSQLWEDKTLGIQQKLVMDVQVTPSGRVLVCCQDKPLYIYERDTAHLQPAENLPDGLVGIRHSNGVGFARDDENYLVLPYDPDQNKTLPETRTIQISTQGGALGSWAPPPTVPTYTHPTDGEIKLHGGNIAVSNVGNIVWVGTNDGPIRATTNGGTSWFTPTFRATAGGAAIDVSKARWHRSRGTRRLILWADPATAGRFLIFVGSELNPGEVAAPYAGVYESTDGGLNFICVAPGAVFGFGQDEYSFKLRPVPGNANHVFFARGNMNSFGSPPAAGGLKFSTAKGASPVDISGFEEVEDIGFGKPKAGSSYPRLLVRGFRGGNIGYWYCDDFNPSNPTAATWNLWTTAPRGRADDDAIIAGDMNKVGLFYVVTSAGGFQILKRDYRLRLT